MSCLAVIANPCQAEDAAPAQGTTGASAVTQSPSTTSSAGTTAPASSSRFTTTVTLYQASVPSPVGDAQNAQAATCWSGGENSWSKQGQRQSPAGDAMASDPIVAKAKDEFLTDVRTWRAFVTAHQYPQAQATCDHALQMLEELSRHGIPVGEQITFTKTERGHCLISDAVGRLSTQWPSSGEESLALAKHAAMDLPGDPMPAHVIDAATAATSEQHGRAYALQVTTLGLHLDQLAAHLLAVRQEVARFTAAGDAGNAHARQLDAAATASACYRDSIAMIPLEQEARSAFQRGLASAKLMLKRAEDGDNAHHSTVAYGVAESSALIVMESSLLAASDAGLARDCLLLGTPAQGLPYAQEAVLLVPDSTTYKDLCAHLQHAVEGTH